jgi:putative endopeptidase
VLALGLACAGCGPSSGSPPAKAAVAADPSVPLAEAPVALPVLRAPNLTDVTLESVGLESGILDRSADPCADFYQFACGKWLEQTPIPADEAGWFRSFDEIQKRNEAVLRSILERADTAQASPEQRQIGTFYAACMDEAAVETAGSKPIADLLAQAGQIKNAEGVAALTLELHQLGIWPLFDISPAQDPKDARRWVASLDQGGLGLPDRDYYLKDDPRSRQLRATYVAHVERMLALARVPAARAHSGAADVLALETGLAKVSKSGVERRDSKHMFNRVERAQLRQAAPSFDWDRYLKQLGLGQIEVLNVTAPRFFEGMSSVTRSASPAALRSYFEWHIVRSLARQLSKAFVDESFQLEQTLTGQAELPPRWRRCLSATDRALGDSLGAAYVKTNFSSESKSAAEGLVQAISTAFAHELNGLTWMDDATRSRASGKQAAMGFLIGYPDHWKTYDFPVDRKAHAQNVLRARAFDLKRELAKVGKLVDRDEWRVNAPVVDAFYNPQLNQMVFPAGILQAPFYNVKSAISVNLGAIGMLVGHELTHGFDDEGAHYDAKGNLENWWSPDVSKRFEDKTACVAQQYSQHEIAPGLHLNGQLTLGENIADMGGVKLAFAAYRALRASAAERTRADGFDEDQQFFLAFGQAWCGKYRPELERLKVQVDPHSPPRFRVRGPLSNLPEFAAAFSCPADSPMRAKTICSVW